MARPSGVSWVAQGSVHGTVVKLGMALLVRDTSHPEALKRACIAMAIGGVALQVKYTVVPQCLFFGLWALWGQYRAGRNLPQIAGIAVGFAVLGLLPTLLVGLFYFAMGGWDEFWFANFVSFFLRAPAPMGRFADQYTIFVMPRTCPSMRASLRVAASLVSVLCFFLTRCCLPLFTSRAADPSASERCCIPA